MIDRPSRFAEALAERLVPPVSAEHVLGDLAESSRTTGQYLSNLASILPRVVWSQVRRRATFGFIVVNGVFTAIGLTIALQATGGGFAAANWAAARAAVPWAVWLAGCALSAAYGPGERPERWNGRLFVATILATLATAWIAGVPLSSVAIALSAVTGLFLTFALPTLRHGIPPPLSRETLLQHARLFQSHIRWRNGRESAAVVVVVSMNVLDLPSAAGLERVAKALLIAAALFISWYLHVRAGSRRVPADSAAALLQFHEREIARQRDVLRAVLYWYLLPFVPGLALLTASKWPETGTHALFDLIGVAALFTFIWWLNRAAARFLDAQLAQVQALESKGW